MARAARQRVLPAVTRDFHDVVAHFRACRLIGEGDQAEKISTAKRIHACTYSIVSWKFRMAPMPANSAPFIEELASDAIQVLPHVLLGYGKTSKLLIRSMLENALRFIYFSDHPVEFRIMNSEQKWFMPTDKLFEYIKGHPDFRRAEKRFDAINRMMSLYDDLSAGVHGRRVIDLQMKPSLEHIGYEHSVGEQEVRLVQRATEAVNYVVMVKEAAKFRGMSVEQRRVILRTLPAQARGVWNDLDEELQR